MRGRPAGHLRGAPPGSHADNEVSAATHEPRCYSCVGGVGRRCHAAAGCTSSDYTVVGIALIHLGAVPVSLRVGTPVARPWAIAVGVPAALAHATARGLVASHILTIADASVATITTGYNDPSAPGRRVNAAIARLVVADAPAQPT